MTTFLEHAVRIAGGDEPEGLWDETDGFFYDALQLPDGTTVPIKVHSMVGLIPLLPAASSRRKTVDASRALGKRFARFLDERRAHGRVVRRRGFVDGGRAASASAQPCVPPVRLERLLGEVLDEDAFLSPHGLRALSRRHRDAPFQLDARRRRRATVDYEPGESTSGLFGGNSNWRGPVWFPVNYLVIESLRTGTTCLGDDVHGRVPDRFRATDVGCATSPRDLARRLVVDLAARRDGRRPVFGAYEQFQTDPDWRDLLRFHEYFHGDTGAGIGASHQTGWTGLVAHLLCRGGLIDTIASGRGTARMGREPTATAASNRTRRD